MSGLINNGLPIVPKFSGNELLNLDTVIAQGQAPQSAAVSLMALSLATKYFNSHADKTTVAGSRYFTNVQIGAPTQVTGVNVLVGTTGGSDNWLVELHDSTGALVATSALAGVLVGTASTFQRIAFTAPVNIAAGTYYIAVQTNGTTAKLATYSSPGLPILAGSATGSFGTSAAITPPTTYTALLAPLVTLY